MFMAVNLSWYWPASVNSVVQPGVNAPGKNIKRTFFLPWKSLRFDGAAPRWGPGIWKSGAVSPTFGELSAPGAASCPKAGIARAIAKIKMNGFAVMVPSSDGHSGQVTIRPQYSNGAYCLSQGIHWRDGTGATADYEIRSRFFRGMPCSYSSARYSAS